jgi:hypothetical protein
MDMMCRANVPLLINIVIGEKLTAALYRITVDRHIITELPNTLPGVQVFPYPIPDLYAGCPVTVAGKFNGIFPPYITVRGQCVTKLSSINIPIVANNK